MAFPVEEGLKLGMRRGCNRSPPGFYGLSSRRRIETGIFDQLFSGQISVFMAFPVEEGLKHFFFERKKAGRNVFMAFPVEEGLKLLCIR